MMNFPVQSSSILKAKNRTTKIRATKKVVTETKEVEDTSKNNEQE